jgi:hypothetical protein
MESILIGGEYALIKYFYSNVHKIFEKNQVVISMWAISNIFTGFREKNS